MQDGTARIERSGRYGHAACVGFVAVFALLWAVYDRHLTDARAALVLCLLPSLALAAILLDLFDTVGEVGERLRRRRGPGRRRFEGTRVAGILVGKAMCWVAVPAILAVAMPGLWQEATGAAVEMPALEVLRNGRELYVRGEIGRGFARRLAETLDRNPGLRSLSLDSLGGMSAEAIEARILVSKRGLDTFVEASCASACIDLFLGGRRREAVPGARFGFHHPGVEIAAIGFDARSEVPAGFLAGLPGAFRDKALATPFGSGWFPDPGALRAAGVVTAFVEGGHALTPRIEWAGRSGAFANLVRPSLLGRLDAGDAASVRGMVDFASRAVREAWPRDAFLDRLRVMVSRTALARVAAGSEDDVRAAGTALLEGMEAIRDGSPALCGRIGAGADLLTVHRLAQARGIPSPVDALLDGARPGSAPAVPAVVAAADGAGGVTPVPEGDCADEISFYRSGIGEEGAARLRSRFSEVVAAGAPAVLGSP